ncbi:hypothetical protein D0T12_13985 [Actinomadura spongiicola]|uniref:Glycosyltransferase RgtA/B/C/D-like domain-containing protein n=1 Tax=Actinomadura spongiicola TaxID=2303421 RepID=A0A372GH08_9ACTN|nr:hypothetical protein [Actinomadura spongiicola]RFS84651.1 hypothetical protein D0T12_13985 [Actinomadura spongiicola]
MSTRTPAVARPPVAPPDRRDVPTGLSRRRWAWLFAVGWLAQVGVRLWLGSGQTVPVATPDESGYLFAARVLTGGPDADMSSGTVYRGGYPLLLTPAFWFGDDPVTVYRGALVINALVSAAMLPLAFLLLRRLGVRGPWAYVFAHVTTALPCVVFYSEFVLTDAVLPVIVMGWLLLVHTWLNGPPPSGSGSSGGSPRGSSVRAALAGAGASALVAYTYASHSRGAILLAVHGALLATAVVCRWRSWRATFLVGAVAAAGTATGTLLNRSLLPHMYPHGDNDLGDNVVRRLTTGDGWGWMLSIGTGQVWYQAVATGGVAAIGLVAVAFAAVRPAGALAGAAGRTRALALGLLAVVGGIAFATSAALPVEYRIGNYAYGRYLATVTPVLFAVGVAVVLRASHRALLWAVASAAAMTVVAASVVQWYAGDLLTQYTYTVFDFPETSFLTWDWASFRLWDATITALALLGASVAVARLRRGGLALFAGVSAVVAVAMCVTATDRIARPLVRDELAHTDLRGSVDLRARRTIAVDWNVPWTIRLSHYYWAWWGEGTVFDARWVPPPRDADMVVLAWPKNVPAAASWPRGAPPGWRVVDSRRTVDGDWVAWAR